MPQPQPPLLIPRWLPIDQAAAALGISARTLRHRAQHDRIERKREDGQTLYRVAGPARHPRPLPIAVATAETAPTAIAAHVAAGAVDLAPLVAALVDAERRAAAVDQVRDQLRTAEIAIGQLRADLATATAERDQVRTAAADLERRHIYRGRLLRQLAKQLGAL